MTALIRDARPDDLDAIERLLAAAFDQYRPLLADSPERRASFDDYLADVTGAARRMGGSDLIVAVNDGAIVGTATLYRPGQITDYAVAVGGKPWPREWAILRYLAVDPRARGQGIGRALAGARIDRARALGAPFAALHTTSHFVASRAMYRRLGWKRAPDYDFAPQDGFLAEAYVLALTPPSKAR